MKYSTMLCALLIAAFATVACSEADVLRTIEVSGLGEIMVVPDRAELNLGVETFAPDLDEAKAANDKIVSAVLDAIKKNGVEEKHLQTDRFNINPRYRETREERTLMGYQVRKSISVTLTDIDKFENVLSAALESGANQVHGFEFQTSEPRKHRDEARALALDAAKEKAVAMAKQYGQNIGRPITIMEEFSGPRVRPLATNVSRFVGGGVGEAGQAMASGRMAVTARVTVKFELVD
jgi:uncharacterized protein YggE